MRTSHRTSHDAVLILAMIAAGVAAACSGDDNGGGGGQQDAASERTAGSGGMGGNGGGAGSGGRTGTGGSAATGGGTGTGGNAGTAGSGGSGVDASTDGGGAGGEPDAGVIDVQVSLPDPALQPDAATVSCPTIINGSLDSSDGRQTGRYSRIAPISACGMTKANPSTAADPANPHLYDVYRFANPTATPVCFTFTLTYGAIVVTDGGSGTADDAEAGADGPSPDAADAQGDSDAGVADAVVESASVDSGEDAAGGDGGVDAAADGSVDAAVADGAADAAATDGAADAAGSDGGVVSVAPPKYLAVFNRFYPTDLTIGYLGDVGDKVTSPQTMGITVPAGGTIDVVVYAIDIAPAGVGSYTLSCSAQ